MVEKFQNPICRKDLFDMFKEKDITTEKLESLFESDRNDIYNLEGYAENLSELTLEQIETINRGFFDDQVIYLGELNALINAGSVYNLESLKSRINSGGNEDMKRIRRRFGMGKTGKKIQADLKKIGPYNELKRGIEKLVTQNEFVNVPFMAHSLDLFVLVDEDKAIEEIREIVEKKESPIVISLMNQKGGVGKTTSSITIADEFTRLGLKTLLIDSDEQANATNSLSYLPNKALPERDYKSYAEIYSENAQIDDMIIENSERFDLVPSSEEVGDVVKVFRDDNFGKFYTLLYAIRNMQTHYDIIIIDCPPKNDEIVINNLTASDFVIIPVEPQDYAIEGYNALIKTIRKVTETGLRPDLRILGYFMNRVGNTNNDKENVERAFNEMTFDYVVPELGRISYLDAAKELKARQLPIFEYAKGSKLAQEYANLINQIARRIVEVYKEGEE